MIVFNILQVYLFFIDRHIILDFGWTFAIILSISNMEIISKLHKRSVMAVSSE